MKNARTLLFLLMACGACGSYDGPQPNAVYFWKLDSSTLAWGQCSDATDFRMGVDPLAVGDSTYVVYRVSADGKTATSQQCARLDSSTCTDLDGGVRYEIVGRELTFTQAFTQPIEGSSCALAQTQTWTITDQTREMTLDISNVLTLEASGSGPDAGSCAEVDAQLAARSPNGLGVEGCVITSTIKGTLK